jgi:2-polyprenyl-3-methyl-5-hydroxy-6-metoxy-1,4-benzoquinol methylase
MQLQNILFENILINGEGQDKFAIIRPIINQFMQEKTCGHIRSVTFKDVDVEGEPGKYQILIEGCAEGNRTSGLAFQNVSILGNILTEDSMRVVFGHNRENYVEMDTIKFTH